MPKENSLLNATTIRHDWQIDEIMQFFNLPLLDLIFLAQKVHRNHFEPNQVQLSSLLNIKTGGCSEDCAYCSQSKRFDTDTSDQALMSVEDIVNAAKKAKEKGSSRFCMGTAWRSPKKAIDFAQILDIIKAVKALDLETCMTLGMLTEEQAQQLKIAGLDYYNHNLDTSPDYYKKIVSTHSYQDRLNTLNHIRNAGLKMCCGGIIGMGETIEDRAALLQNLANLPIHPESVPINQLIPIEGTPLGKIAKIDTFDIVRCIATARILMPTSYVRLSAGRTEMSDELQALCFLAGANSVFYGEKLLTTDNPNVEQDQSLFKRLGLQII